MAVATACALNGDFDSQLTKNLRAAPIACRKRDFVEELDSLSLSPPVSAKRSRFGEYTFSEAAPIARRKRVLVEEELDFQSPPPFSAKRNRLGEYTFSQYDDASTAQGSDKAAWVDLMIKEMMGASSVDDAKTRAARLFDSLKESIAASVAEEFEERLDALSKENSVLKRAVAIQHHRHKEYDQVNALVGKYQHQVRSLEINNYALQMHLQQALLHSKLTVSSFNPEVF